MKAEDRPILADAAGELSDALAQSLRRPITPETRELAARHVLDWTACAVAGRQTDTGALLGRYADAAAPGPVTAIGVGRRAFDAGLICNAAAGNILRMGDLHRAHDIHPGTVVIPAALAAAEARAATPATFLDAVIHGYEIALQVAGLMNPAEHPAAGKLNRTATAGRYGAAAAAAHVLGLDAEGVAAALRLAASLVTLGQAEAEDAPARHFQNAEAALGGARAALLATHGLMGPAQAVGGPRGLLGLLGEDGAEIAITPDAPWLMAEVAILPWGSCHHAHGAIDAALALRAKLDPDDLRPERIREVRVATHAAALQSCDLPQPRSLNEARFSLQHGVALALLGGAPGLSDFSPSRCGDAAVAALRHKVRLAAEARFTNACPQHCGANVTLVMEDGEVLSQEIADPRGSAARPLSIDELVAKARELLAWSGTMDAADADRLIEAALYLPDAGSLSSFLKALP